MSVLLRDLHRLLRFAAIYGPMRALTKALGRIRLGWMPRWPISLTRTGVGFVGCGQFAFSTVAYYVRGIAKCQACFDIDVNAAASLARFFGVRRVYTDYDQFLADESVKVVYIATNHASHADYAIRALHAGKDVYVEKPVAVSTRQLADLSKAIQSSKGRVFAGYNRPVSAAIRDLRGIAERSSGPLTLSCFVSGHFLPMDHWYRNPEEGTRICGNLGHWLDLAVHIVSWRGLPDRWNISVTWSAESAPDDNLAVTLTSQAGDLVNLVLSARMEPYEGINETIHLLWDDVIAKIDDFRRQTIWCGSKLVRLRYWPKNAGHEAAIRQPFSKDVRPWKEVEDSTLLMLRVMEMVRSLRQYSAFSFAEARSEMERVANATGKPRVDQPPSELAVGQAGRNLD